MLNSLSEIVRFSDVSIQFISRNIDDYCLAIALSNESEKIKNRVFSNLSKRRLIEIVKILLLHRKAEDDEIYVDELKQTINRLIYEGKVFLEEDEYELDTNKLESEETNKKDISGLDFNNFKTLSDFFLMLNYETRLKGLLALEPYLNDIEDINLRSIFELILDGCGDQHISLYMSNMEQNSLRKQKIKMEIIKTGVSIILNGESSIIAKKLMKAVYNDN